MLFAPIDNPTILIKPSSKLLNFIQTLKECDEMPGSILKLLKNEPSQKLKNTSDFKYYLTDDDRKFIDKLSLNKDIDNNQFKTEDYKLNKNENLLCLSDLYWLHDTLKRENENNSEKLYFHELFEGSKIILPENVPVERNPVLEKRCELLRNQQDDKLYKAMTKNVDNVRKRHPEDTISYQLKQINRQLIAIAQFIFSVVTGFIFGFIGIELIIGNMDFGFRLLLGIICALIIALAELYFLAKKLNEDLQIETKTEGKVKKS